ncbi:hypothetical protein NE237_012276 [Protea cynaroides]|uniref:BHLH domain-containing protein n=1 Tax=Protea cynaroides TaxID=273540 RepID=A0A9Q0GZI3_9MAGN|nr:hypothetical protein NE237_012276 [Protea cynaroides]
MDENKRGKGVDFIPPADPLFPSQQSDELFFPATSTAGQQQTDPQQNTLFMAAPSLDCTDLLFELDIPGLGRRKPSATPNSCVETCNDEKKKKDIHRDVERQRRQEMATFYASLRSQIPLEYLKGKRSISDHINEASNYVRDLQKRIQELNHKRDGLRKMSNSGAPDTVVSQNCPPDYVTVQPCWGGVEVMINSGFKNGEFPLSRVIRELVDQGVRVVTTVSSTVNERSFHTIKSEVSDLTTLDLSELEEKLTDLVASSSS